MNKTITTPRDPSLQMYRITVFSDGTKLVDTTLFDRNLAIHIYRAIYIGLGSAMTEEQMETVIARCQVATVTGEWQDVEDIDELAFGLEQEPVIRLTLPEAVLKHAPMIHPSLLAGANNGND